MPGNCARPGSFTIRNRNSGLCLSAAGTVDPRTDTARFVELVERACDGGDASACYQMGMVFSEGELNLKADLARATELYRRACDADLAEACFNLAWQYLRGQGAPKDDRTGDALLERSCTLGDASACGEIARRGGDRRRACDRWGKEACYDLAVEVARARGETACAEGSTSACAARVRLAP